MSVDYFDPLFPNVSDDEIWQIAEEGGLGLVLLITAYIQLRWRLEELMK